MDYSQYKNKPFQVISKLQVRYTGVFQDIDQESQTLCLSEVFNHGTEDRPSQRVLPGSPVSLGWVRFHTNSIDSLALVQDYVPPNQQPEEEPVDPIIASASVNQAGPASHQRGPAAPQQARGNNGVASLPPKPVASTSSANAALDRVQKSLSELSTDGGRRRNKPQPPAVPDAEFDFSKGTERFQKERQAFKASVEGKGKDGAEGDSEAVEIGEPENQPHPSALSGAVSSTGSASPTKADRKAAAYNKSSFFDNISSDTSRVSRADERHRNLDTFGEAGGSDAYGQGGGMRGRGGYGGRGRGRGGPRRGSFGHHQQSQAFGQ